MDKSLCDRLYCGALMGAYRFDPSQAEGMSRDQVDGMCTAIGYSAPRDFCTDPACASLLAEARSSGKEPCRPPLPLRVAPPEVPASNRGLVLSPYQVTMDMVHRPQCESRCQFSKWVARYPLAAAGLILLGYLLLNGGTRK